MRAPVDMASKYPPFFIGFCMVPTPWVIAGIASPPVRQQQPLADLRCWTTFTSFASNRWAFRHFGWVSAKLLETQLLHSTFIPPKKTKRREWTLSKFGNYFSKCFLWFCHHYFFLKMFCWSSTWRLQGSLNGTHFQGIKVDAQVRSFCGASLKK